MAVESPPTVLPLDSPRDASQPVSKRRQSGAAAAAAAVASGGAASSAAASAGGDEASVVLSSERFRVPEILFTPADVGLDQMGLAEMAVDAILACPAGQVFCLFCGIMWY